MYMSMSIDPCIYLKLENMQLTTFELLCQVRAADTNVCLIIFRYIYNYICLYIYLSV